jgi:hypothetical protein
MSFPLRFDACFDQLLKELGFLRQDDINIANPLQSVEEQIADLLFADQGRVHQDFLFVAVDFGVNEGCHREAFVTGDGTSGVNGHCGTFDDSRLRASAGSRIIVDIVAAGQEFFADSLSAEAVLMVDVEIGLGRFLFLFVFAASVCDDRGTQYGESGKLLHSESLLRKFGNYPTCRMVSMEKNHPDCGTGGQ